MNYDERITRTYGDVDPRKVQFDRDNYQREYRKKTKGDGIPEYLPSEWVLSLLPVLVSRRDDGSLWAMDGQHRLIEAVRLKLPKVPAVILEGLTIEEEALLFAYINDGARRPQPAELWKALSTGQEPKALALAQMLKEEGITLRAGRASPLDNDRTTTQIKALQWVVNRHGLNHLRRTLRFLLRTWPGATTLLGPDTIRGVAVFLHRADSLWPSQADAELSDTLNAFSLPDLREEHRMRIRMWHGTVSATFASLLEETVQDLREVQNGFHYHEVSGDSEDSGAAPLAALGAN